jgi:hypothetical protein
MRGYESSKGDYSVKGKILGYDQDSNEGAIIGTDGNRYSFSKEEWKGQGPPTPETTVDFIADGEAATKIYPVRDKDEEQSKMVLGIVSLVITFFLGFIGTLISRMAISKQSFSLVLVPVLIHFVITALAFIPVIGWVIYVVGTIYFMVKNYQLINKPI